MNKFILTALLICLHVGSLQAQNTASPKYLTTQNFPDSVKQLSLLSHTGEVVRFEEVLKAHKGKKVLIDFWASWCRDCIVSAPILRALQKETSKKKVSYIFLSVDENKKKWNTAIKRYKLEGDHYRIASGWKSTLTNYIELDWIPRYIIIINKKGRIIVPKSVKIGDERLSNQLLKD